MPVLKGMSAVQSTIKGEEPEEPGVEPEEPKNPSCSLVSGGPKQKKPEWVKLWLFNGAPTSPVIELQYSSQTR